MTTDFLPSAPEEPDDFGSEPTSAPTPEKPIDFGTELKNDTRGEAITSDVTAKDLFELGKRILLAVLFLLVFVSGARIGYDDSLSGVKEVWEFSKVFLSSIVSLILGYYFGDKKK